MALLNGRQESIFDRDTQGIYEVIEALDLFKQIK
jgi:hypothetical protein